MLTTPVFADILASAEAGTSCIDCAIVSGSRAVPRAALTPLEAPPKAHIGPTPSPVGCAAAGDAAAINAAAVTPASASDTRRPDVEILNVHPPWLVAEEESQRLNEVSRVRPHGGPLLQKRADPLLRVVRHGVHRHHRLGQVVGPALVQVD